MSRTLKSSYEKEVQALFKKAGITNKYEAKKYPVQIIKNTSYRPDFELSDSTIIEVKGNHRFVKDSLIKLAAFIDQYPNKKVIMIAAEVDDKIPKWRSMTLRKFCQSNKIQLLELEQLGQLKPKQLNKIFDELRTS